MQILLVIDSMKKATVYANELHTSEVILTFSIYLFYFIEGPKKISSPAQAICDRTHIAFSTIG